MAVVEGWRFRWSDVSLGFEFDVGKGVRRGLRYLTSGGVLVLSSRRGLWWSVL